MSETDRQDRQDTTAKTTRWAFTAYKDQWNLFREGHIPATLAEWGWNTEKCPETGREHYQGYLRTKQQVRLSQLKKQFPGVHLEPARNWEATKKYAGKLETRVPGTEPVSEVSEIPDIYGYTIAVAKQMPSRKELEQMLDERQEQCRRHKIAGCPPDFASLHCESINQLMEYMVELVVKQDILNGKFYAGHIAVNPQWVSLWRKFGLQYIDGVKNNLPY